MRTKFLLSSLYRQHLWTTAASLLKTPSDRTTVDTEICWDCWLPMLSSTVSPDAVSVASLVFRLSVVKNICSAASWVYSLLPACAWIWPTPMFTILNADLHSVHCTVCWIFAISAAVFLHQSATQSPFLSDTDDINQTITEFCFFFIMDTAT